MVPLAIALAEGGQGIGGFTALGDGKNECLVADRWIAVAKFAGVFHLNRNSGQFFDHIFTHHGGVPTGAAGGKDDAVDLAQLLRTEIQTTEHGRGIVVAQPAPHGIAKRLRLFVNLFEHVVVVTAEAHTIAILGEWMDGVFDVSLIAMDHLERIAGNDCHFMIGQINDLFGVADHRCGIAGDKMFAFADSDHHRAAEPGTDKHIRMFAEQGYDAVGAAKL